MTEISSFAKSFFLPLRRPAAAVRPWITGFLVLVAALGACHIGVFHAIGSGLDPSWVAALGEAAAHGEKFGRDLIFTGGPLSALYTGYFDSVQWPWAVLAGILTAITLAWSCARLASNWLVAVLFPILILIASFPDPVLMSVPVFAALAVLTRPSAPFSFVLLAAVTTAALTVAKFSTVPAACVAFIAIDCALVHERRLPVGVIAFFAAMAGWFAILEGGLTYFYDFLRFSIEIMAGYSAAMSIDGSGPELVAFILLAMGFSGVVLYAAYKQSISNSVLKSVLVIAVLGAFCFMGFKEGFVRHDLHSLAAWGVLALACAAYAALENSNGMRWLVVALSIISAGAAPEELYRQMGVGPLTTISDHLRRGRDSLAGLADLALNPRDWLEAQQVAMDRGRAAVRASMPLPMLQGSVDVLSSIQSAVIAGGLAYRPRFTIQEFTTYTAALIAKNRESWFGPRSPDHILFGLDPIDGHYPALAEGSLWPDLMRLYEPTQRIDGGNLVVLSRRQRPLPEILSAPVRQTTRLGERIAIGPDPTFLTLDIRLNWLGRLLSLLFKPPLVHLQLEYANGNGGQNDYRIIPAIARAGFIISPRVNTADDFIFLAMGDVTAFGQSARPGVARVDIGPIGSWAYSNEVDVTLRTINIDILEHYGHKWPGLHTSSE